MCNRFNLKTEPSSLASLFDAMLRQPITSSDSGDIFPKSLTATIAMNGDGRRELLPMAFGLVPFGKDAASQKYPLTNARVENLAKWPWKSSIGSYRCVVPMRSFREPCYWGETAGQEVDFIHDDESPMLAAAIFSWSKSVDADKTVDTRFSMSLIMRPALPVVMEHGHHRSPFFIDAAGIDAWMSRESRTVDEARSVLAEHAVTPALKMSAARTMAPAWKKRQSDHLAKRDEQIASIKTTGPLGIESTE